MTVDALAETPISSSLAGVIDTVDEWRDESSDEPGWRFLSTYDLRRTRATALSDVEVDSLLVLDGGGWGDLETFLDHYKGARTRR